MSIIWKKIKNFDNYEVSNTGKVRSINFQGSKNTQELKPWSNYKGYLLVYLCKNGNRIHKKIHRLVAETFISNPDKKLQINHKNGIKADNRVENLEWATNSENQKHRYRVLGHKSATKGKFGAENPSSKPVIQLKNDIIIAEFGGMLDAERKTGIRSQDIGKCCVGKRKSAGGYNWKYKQKEKQ